MTAAHSETIRQLVVQALLNRTLAEDRVYPRRDWPVTSKEMPGLLVYGGKESGVSRGPMGFPAFHTVTFMTIDFRVEGKEGQDADDVGDVLSSLWWQVKAAILSDDAIQRNVEQIAEFRCDEPEFSAGTKRHVGTMRADFAFAYPEDFEPVITDSLDIVNAHADMAGTFDPTGIYVDPAFPDAVTPAPRTSGPDGRDEGRVFVDFTS